MFLKRIEMQGFKSFADRTVITFDHPITGVVGPNGCGKSNISDAVRWVLGEQSAKSLRGDKMHDVIFAGSADRKKLNMAEVTLVFDNSSHVLNTETDEIEVTRKLYRESGDAEYLINKRNVRLRDVVDLFLDTGLGKDSLSIISQGNVISFAESKPQDRRGIFEEAAGVAKYRKRRLESLSRLERTKANLERLEDILAELEKQVSPLKRQARKAEIYREKKKQLEEIEISVLVQDITEINEGIQSAKDTLFNIEAETAVYSTDIQVNETQIQTDRRSVNLLDIQINDLQDALMKNVSEVQTLEARKTELDERKKYIIETGNAEEKAKETKSLLEEARIEYEDRKNRLDELNREISLWSMKLNQAAQIIVDSQAEYERENGLVRQLENRRNILDSQIRNPFNNQQGVRSIMEHRQALHGILGVAGQVLIPEAGYEEAVSTALGGALNNIITENEASARDAIRFLTRNQSGRATFLPLTVCQPRWVARDAQIICENTKGYLGTAADFVSYDSRFEPVVKGLLANVLVCESMEAGNELSALTRRSYKIVTLSGEVIHRGGSMTGGRTQHNANIMTVKSEFEAVEKQLDSERARLELARRKLSQANADKDSASRSLQEKRYAAAALEPVVDVKQAKYEKLKNDLALLLPDAGSEHTREDSHAEELVTRLNRAYSERDRITGDIRTKRQQRTQLNSDCDRKEAQLRQLRKELKTAEASANAIRLDQTRLETMLASDLQRLASEYQLTFEFAKTRATDQNMEDAKSQVALLRSEIERLGNINMNAPEEYTAANERYENMKHDIEDLTLSRDKMLAAIDEMDTVMKKQFKETFDLINREFNDIFRSLYGGGKARLVLQDPEDLLNTGIDIDAQPPGKAVQNNKLFSGGEKSLIALCVLFAILKAKPVPLVILDEVEAALDPGNVERFAQYLHNYTDRTQFIVVTHRPGTMENADVLYGVTMQQQGVSQMLKVTLRDAMEMADTNTEVNT